MICSKLSTLHRHSPLDFCLQTSQSRNAKRIRVSILNPVAGCGHTSLAHARRYVKRGVAVWEGQSIRFVVQAAASGHGGRPTFHIEVREILDSGLNAPFLRWPMAPDRIHEGRVLTSSL